MKLSALSIVVTAYLFVAAINLAPANDPGSPPAGKIQVGILWWPADPNMAMHSFSSRIEECLTKTLEDAAPEIAIRDHKIVHDMLYPLMEFGTQPASEQAFAELLRRDDVRGRLRDRGLQHLIAFSGSTRTSEWEGGIFCGGGYQAAGCLGFAWADKETILKAVLWDLRDDSAPVHEEATDTGTSMMPAFLLPIRIPARTQSDACEDLGQRIANSILKQTTNANVE